MKLYLYNICTYSSREISPAINISSNRLSTRLEQIKSNGAYIGPIIA